MTAPDVAAALARRLRTVWAPLVAALALPALLACPPGPGPDAGDGDGDAGPGGPAWEMVLEGEPGALLSLTGTAADDVWIVGADRRDGTGPTVLHYDGTGFDAYSTGDEGDLWWVARSSSGALWMAGDGGRVFRVDPEAKTFTPVPTPSTARLYGVLPFADDDVWAVGDDGGEAALWRYDGVTWSIPDVPPGLLDGLVLFKVWGPSPDEVWIVGQGGSVLRFTSASGFERFPLPVARTVFTVHGNDNVTLGVGGFIDGLIVELGPSGPEDVTPDRAPELVGVYVSPDGSAVAAGYGGAIWQRSSAGVWTDFDDVPGTFNSYHAAFRDPAGGVWAVGGFLDGEPLQQGMLAHLGDPLVAEIRGP